jgi:hypothetical protein
MRITQKQQQEMSKYQLTVFQQATYNSLLSYQIKYPKLTNAQYKLFESIFQQIKKENKESIKYHV